MYTYTLCGCAVCYFVHKNSESTPYAMSRKRITSECGNGRWGDNEASSTHTKKKRNPKKSLNKSNIDNIKLMQAQKLYFFILFAAVATRKQKKKAKESNKKEETTESCSENKSQYWNLTVNSHTVQLKRTAVGEGEGAAATAATRHRGGSSRWWCLWYHRLWPDLWTIATANMNIVRTEPIHSA